MLTKIGDEDKMLISVWGCPREEMEIQARSGQFLGEDVDQVLTWAICWELEDNMCGLCGENIDFVPIYCPHTLCPA